MLPGVVERVSERHTDRVAPQETRLRESPYGMREHRSILIPSATVSGEGRVL